MLSEYIQNHCLTKKHTLNNRVCIKSWWTNRSSIHIYDAISKETEFLDENCLFSERCYCITHNIIKVPRCQECKTNQVTFHNYHNGYRKYCSNYCVTHSQERNDKIIASHDYVQDQKTLIENNLKNYGVAYSFQRREVIDKIEKTKLTKYGNKFYNNPTKMIETNIRKYGFPYTVSVSSVQRKSQETIQSRTPELWDPIWLTNQNQTKSLTEISETLGVTYRTVWLAFERLDLEPNFFQPKYNKMEHNILDYLQKDLAYAGEIRYNDRNVLAPKELDFYFPNKALALELNGTYWHSFDTPPTKVEKEKHVHKLESCKAKGIRLLQIWDTEWLEKPKIVQDIIQRALGLTQTIVHGKDTKIVTLSTKEYQDFLNKNHLQGYTPGSVKLGLKTVSGELVSCMSFTKTRYTKKYDYELVRYCSKQNVGVTGGAQKLFHAFIKTLDADDTIISYSDKRLFIGNLYKTLGFSFHKTTALDYYWIQHSEILNRLTTQKHKLKDFLPNFDPNLTEDDNMFAAGYRKLYGCGHDSWIYKKAAI